MTPASDSSRTVTMRIRFWYCASPATMRPVCPPEMPNTYSMPASSSTRPTSALAGVSSVSIRSIAIAALPLHIAREACLRGARNTTLAANRHTHLRNRQARGSDQHMRGLLGIAVMTYALCGFANFGSLGILIGGMGAMAPERRAEIVGLGLRAILS